MLQMALSKKISGSLSIVGVWGNDNFTSTSDYEGAFQSYSGSAKHVKFTYSSSDTCRAVAVGGTLDGDISIGVGYTNYYEVWNNIV